MLHNGFLRRGPALVGWLLLAVGAAVLTGRIDPGTLALRLAAEPPGGTVTVDGGARTLDDPVMRAAVAAVNAALRHDGAFGGPVRAAAGEHAAVVPYRLGDADWRAVRATLGAVRAAYPQVRIAQTDPSGAVDRVVGRRAAAGWLMVGALLVAACAVVERWTARRTADLVSADPGAADPAAVDLASADPGAADPAAVDLASADPALAGPALALRPVQGVAVAASSTAASSESATGRPVAFRSGRSVNPPAYSTQAAPASAAA
jgi:hypothetical protein